MAAAPGSWRRRCGCAAASRGVPGQAAVRYWRAAIASTPAMNRSIPNLVWNSGRSQGPQVTQAEQAPAPAMALSGAGQAAELAPAEPVR